jgi:hypothetical protein
MAKGRKLYGEALPEKEATDSGTVAKAVRFRTLYLIPGVIKRHSHTLAASLIQGNITPIKELF